MDNITMDDILSDKVLTRYAKWIAEEDMLRIGLNIKVLQIDNVNKSNKEKNHA